jgi:hypothetical protein
MEGRKEGRKERERKQKEKGRNMRVQMSHACADFISFKYAL